MLSSGRCPYCTLRPPCGHFDTSEDIPVQEIKKKLSISPGKKSRSPPRNNHFNTFESNTTMRNCKRRQISRLNKTVISNNSSLHPKNYQIPAKINPKKMQNIKLTSYNQHEVCQFLFSRLQCHLFIKQPSNPHSKLPSITPHRRIQNPICLDGSHLNKNFRIRQKHGYISSDRPLRDSSSKSRASSNHKLSKFPSVHIQVSKTDSKSIRKQKNTKKRK